MNKFHLNADQTLQGDFIVQDLNFAFVFQVNCPGCFIYGIPMVNELYKSFKDQISFIGIATAFEDFEYNSKENLQLLLNDGTLIGETKKYFAQNGGLSTYNHKIDFPVAFDKMVEPEEFFASNQMQLLYEQIPYFDTLSKFQKEEFQDRIKNHFTSIPKIAETFTLNQLRGTPSFIVFDKYKTILGSYFGHMDINEIQDQLLDLITNRK